MTPGAANAARHQAKLREQLGRDPTHTEVAKSMGLPKSAADYLLCGKCKSWGECECRRKQ